MNVVYDLILVLILAANVRRGWRQGVLSALLGVLGWAIAAVLLGGSDGDAASLLLALAALVGFRCLARLSARRRRGRGILGKTNQLLGGVLGLLEGLVTAYVYVFLLSLLASLLSAGWLSPALLQSTFLVRRFLL